MNIHIDEIPFSLVCLYAIAAAAIGFWRGGAERAVIGAVLLGQVALGLGYTIAPGPGLVEDTATLIICLAVALRGRGYWTLWAAASPALSIVTQALRIGPGLSDWSFYSAQQAWFLELATALLVGALWPSRQPAMAPAGS
jgi:hypothetical protein